MPRWVKAFVLAAHVLIVLVLLMVAGVFGSGHGPGRHMGGAHENAPSTAVGGPAEATAADRTIAVSALDTMIFEPNQISVAAGEIVTFVVTNAGRTVHEFTLGDAAMQREHGQAMTHMPAGMGHDTENSIRLQPGETKRLTWRFGGSGPIEFACHSPGHYEAGMRGELTIA